MRFIIKKLFLAFFLSSLFGNEQKEFSIIIIPDTQRYSDYYPQHFISQTEWIVANIDSLNIVYVAHLGDIVENVKLINEWENADKAMKILENVITDKFPDGIPFGVVPGNHDTDFSDDTSTANFNSYFGANRFNGRTYYGGAFSFPKNDNNYTLFSVSGMDFIVINLDWQSNDEELKWADNLLKVYKTHRAIVVSHFILLGRYSVDVDNWIKNGNGIFSLNGERIYNSLKNNKNLFLMLSGHEFEESKRIDNYYGNIVYSLLSDYQWRPNGGNGWLRILTFYPEKNKIKVRTYSPILDKWEIDSDSEFEIFYNMDENLSTIKNINKPNEFKLHQNYPNPFNSSTTLQFDLPKTSNIILSIHSLSGQEIRTFNLNYTSPGNYSIKWDSTNKHGDPVVSGIYFYRLSADKYVKVRKMLILR